MRSVTKFNLMYTSIFQIYKYNYKEDDIYRTAALILTMLFDFYKRYFKGNGRVIYMLSHSLPLLGELVYCSFALQVIL